MRREKVETYDTTLRDGTQREGISLSCEDKLRIAQRLDALGIDVIEAGYPGSNPKDAEVFRRARDMEWSHAQLAAFGSTRRPNSSAETDLHALLDAHTPVCTLFGKSSTLHVEQILGTTREENLAMIEESIAFLHGNGRRVIYDAEHFFDGFALDPSYALETLRAAERGGADVIVLCDTNGGTLPSAVAHAVLTASETVGVRLGIHAHDDIGCAIASSLVAVEAGATHVQGTINGYGERCGNADLIAVIAGIELKLRQSVLPPGRLSELSSVSRFVAEIANLAHDPHRPYVGRSAFAHKGGVHVAAVRRNPDSYQHVDPAIVGNELRVVVSELSGRATVRSKAEELGIAIAGEADREVVHEIKAREAEGASYEAAEASIALMVRRKQPDYAPPFRILDWKVIAQGQTVCEATIKIDLGGRAVHTAAEGCGPVAALDAALRKALFPAAESMRLADYKVRILDGRVGTAAVTRVLVDTTDGNRTWSTVGAAPSILEASMQALADGYEYGLDIVQRHGMEEVA